MAQTGSVSIGGAELITDHGGGDPAKELEGPLMARQPVGDLLGARGLGVGVVGGAEDGDEELDLGHLLAQRIWVMDRGMTSTANLTWLRETGRRYLVGTPKSELKRWAPQLADAQDWHTVRDGVEAKRCPGPEGAETFVLASRATMPRGGDLRCLN